MAWSIIWGWVIFLRVILFPQTLKATLILGEFVQQHREKTLETVVASSLPPKNDAIFRGH